MTSLYPSFSFTITKQDSTSRARLGKLMTPHGTIETPAFIFCATKGALKSVRPCEAKKVNTQIILSNTYHLMLNPGADLVDKMGGIHRFMGWDGPMLTDSGGFQIFSLGHGSVAAEIKGKRNSSRPKTLMKITEEGATFKSYLNGSRYHLTPEKSIEVQVKLGADLIVVLDECTPFHVSKTYTAKSMERSHRWEIRSLEEFKRRSTDSQALYGIIQGGIYEDLRQQSIDFVNSQPFFGHAIGGSLGALKEQMYEVVHFTASRLEANRPIHLLGIGGIRDIFEGVRAGIDTFDCVHPTRLARHGGALVPAFVLEKEGEDPTSEHLNIRKARFKEDPAPIDSTCPCYTCQTVSRSYLHYLIKAKETVLLEYLTLHNMAFMNRLLTTIREAIMQNMLNKAQKDWAGI